MNIVVVGKRETTLTTDDLQLTPDNWQWIDEDYNKNRVNYHNTALQINLKTHIFWDRIKADSGAWGADFLPNKDILGFGGVAAGGVEDVEVVGFVFGVEFLFSAFSTFGSFRKLAGSDWCVSLVVGVSTGGMVPNSDKKNCSSSESSALLENPTSAFHSSWSCC